MKVQGSFAWSRITPLQSVFILFDFRIVTSRACAVTCQITTSRQFRQLTVGIWHCHDIRAWSAMPLVCLVAGLPIKDGVEGMLAEVLFSQMLCLPNSHFKPVAYSAIVVRTRSVPAGVLFCMHAAGASECCEDERLWSQG